MSEDVPFEGFHFQFSSPDANAPGGTRIRSIYAIARPPLNLSALPVGSMLVESGSHILEKARELGIRDDDYKIIDADS
jgi:hypothetical protein